METLNVYPETKEDYDLMWDEYERKFGSRPPATQDMKTYHAAYNAVYIDGKPVEKWPGDK
jgi:hypothetical protein